MARNAQRGRWRQVTTALAGAAVLVLAGCAAEPPVDPPGGAGVASAAGATPTAEPANPASSTGSGNPSSRDQAARSGAGSATSAGRVNSASQPRPASRASCQHGSAFALSLVSDYYGWASPVEAAQHFARQSNPAGYGTPTTAWTASASDQSGVTLTATGLMLHAMRLPNGRWAIDSGERCN